MAIRLPPDGNTGYGKLKLYSLMHDAVGRVNRRRDAQASMWLLLSCEEVPWWSGKEYTGHSLSKRDDGWLLVVRAAGRGGPVVAFFSGTRQADAVMHFAHCLVHDLVHWKEDKFRK